MATRLHYSYDQKTFDNLAQKIKEGYRSRFYDENTNTWGNGNQSSLSGTVYHGLCDSSEAKDIMKKLLLNLKDKNYHLETGVVGTKYMIEALARFGHSDVVYRIVSKRTFPSLGYWMEQGATTLWQNWDGTQSQNHVMFGSVDEWFYKSLAGIKLDEKQPGFERVFISPAFLNGLQKVKGNYQSYRGLISSEWEKSGKKIKWRVVIPVNVKGNIILPFASSKLNRVKIGKRYFWINGKMTSENAPGIKRVIINTNEILLYVQPGEYQFEIELK